VTLLVDGVSKGTTVAAQDGTWKITSTALTPGIHNVTATATDIASNVVSAPSPALQINIDVTPPAAPSAPDMTDLSDTGTSNTDNITKLQTPTFTGTADKGTTVTLFDGANPIGTATADVTTGAWTITSNTSLSQGPHTITAKATDTAGNPSGPSPALNIQIDIILPATPGTPDLEAGSDNGPSDTDNNTSINTPFFTGTGEIGTFVDLLSDGTIVGTGAVDGTGHWRIQTSALSGGQHTNTARGRDTAGNVSSSDSAGLIVTIGASTAAPSTPDLIAASDDGASPTDNITSVTKPTFTGTAPAGSLVELLIGGNTVVGSATATNGTWTITLTNALAIGTYQFTARATLNQSVSPQSAQLQVQIVAAQGPAVPSTPDLIAPSDTGSSQTDNLTKDNTPTFSGTGPANTTIEILIGGTTVVGSGTSDGQGNWTVTAMNPITPDGQYSFTARSKNQNGTSNQSGALLVTFDTSAPGATSKPVLDPASDTGLKGDNITDDFTPTFHGTGPANTIIDLLANNTSFGSATSDGQGNWTITSTALPNGTFAFSSRSRDTAGNTSPNSATQSVTITNSPPAQPPLTISSYTLVNADNGQDLFDLSEGITLDLSTLPARLAIRANPAPTNVASIKFGYDQTPGSFNANYRIESLLPYALFADSANGTKYNPGTFTLGSHTLTGTPYSKPSAGGIVGTANTLHFKVIQGQNPPPPTTGAVTFTLVNADNGQDIQVISEGATLDLSKLPANLSVRANPTVGGVNSVRFGYDLTSGSFNSNFHTESQAPFSLNGDTVTKYTPVKFNAGSHTMSGTLFSGGGAGGTNLGSSSVHFTVTGTGQPPTQATVTSFTLINAATDQVIRTLVNNDTLNLASLPAQLAIRANTSGTVGSVKFGWDPTAGVFNSSFHTETQAPYTLFGDQNNGADYLPGTISKGNHTLTGTVFSAAGGGGTAQGSLTIKFAVT
jgi:hypothetical protein